ncbi:MAG: hypothetical protein RLZZ437_2987 [Pseudomonadota bacterium]
MVFNDNRETNFKRISTEDDFCSLKFIPRTTALFALSREGSRNTIEGCKEIHFGISLGDNTSKKIDPKRTIR